MAKINTEIATSHPAAEIMSVEELFLFLLAGDFIIFLYCFLSEKYIKFFEFLKGGRGSSNKKPGSLSREPGF